MLHFDQQELSVDEDDSESTKGEFVTFDLGVGDAKKPVDDEEQIVSGTPNVKSEHPADNSDSRSYSYSEPINKAERMTNVCGTEPKFEISSLTTNEAKIASCSTSASSNAQNGQESENLRIDGELDTGQKYLHSKNVLCTMPSQDSNNKAVYENVNFCVKRSDSSCQDNIAADAAINKVNNINESEFLADSEFVDYDNIDDSDDDDDDGWQEMATVANNYDVYDDRGELINGSRDTKMNEAKKNIELKHEKEAIKKKKQRWNPLASHNNKSKEGLKHDAMHNSTGYTRIAIQSQAESYAQTDKKTDFLFQNNNSHCSILSKKKGGTIVSTNDEYESTNSPDISDDSSKQIDSEDHDVCEEYEANFGTKTAVDQLQTTKSMLKDNEIFAYVGLVKLILIDMATDMAKLNIASDLKNSKRISAAQLSMAVWANSVMTNLYDHMGLIEEEIEMIEKLSKHGLEPEDLVKSLVKLETVNNPVYDNEEIKKGATIVKITEDDDYYESFEVQKSVNSLEDVKNVTASNQEKSSVGSPGIQKASKVTREKNVDQFTEENMLHFNSIENKLDGEEERIDISNANKSEDNELKKNLDADDELDITDMKRENSMREETVQKDNDSVFSNKDPLAQKTIKIDLAWTVVCDLFLILIYDSVYDSRSRTLLMKFGNFLKLLNFEICRFEKRITDALEIEENTEETLNENEFIKYRSKRNKRKRLIYIGLAGVGGSLILGISGGLLGPLIGAGIAAGLSTVGIAGTSGFLAGTAGTAIVTTVSTGIGAKVGLQGMMKRTGSVKTFEFKPLHSNRRVNLIITVSGWMNSISDDIRLPFLTVDPVMGDLYSLLWEPEMLTTMGQTINILANEILTQSVQQILGATILTAFMASIQVPMALLKLSYILDNPWNVSLDRAWLAGLILADTLISRNLGVRPITLVGFSIGSRLIYSCLLELAKKGAYDLVENVIIFGSPFVCNKEHLMLCRSVILGRFVNGYSKKDWILGYLFRATSGGIRRVVGLSEVHDIEGIENFDCTPYVTGHMEYRTAMPKLLKMLGIEVLSEDFIEIDEPDAEETERQRKLVLEFDKNAEQILKDKKNSSHKKSKWKSWFKPKRKEWWEVYAEGQVASGTVVDKKDDKNPVCEGHDSTSEYEVAEHQTQISSSRNSALFNVEELKKEIAKMKANGDLDELNSEMKKISSADA